MNLETKVKFIRFDVEKLKKSGTDLELKLLYLNIQTYCILIQSITSNHIF